MFISFSLAAHSITDVADFKSVGFNRFFTNLNRLDLQTRFLSDSDLIFVLVRFGH